MNRATLLLILGLCPLLTVGCVRDPARTPAEVSVPAATSAPPPGTPSPGRPAGDLTPFIAQLGERGVAVEQIAEAQQPFLRPIGARLRLRGGPLAGPAEIESYAYDRPATAADDAARVQPDTSARWVDPDGRVRTASFAWVGPPHFFRRGVILIVYIGADPGVLALLADLLGPQFAGRP